MLINLLFEITRGLGEMGLGLVAGPVGYLSICWRLDLHLFIMILCMSCMYLFVLLTNFI